MVELSCCAVAGRFSPRRGRRRRPWSFPAVGALRIPPPLKPSASVAVPRGTSFSGWRRLAQRQRSRSPFGVAAAAAAEMLLQHWHCLPQRRTQLNRTRPLPAPPRRPPAAPHVAVSKGPAVLRTWHAEAGPNSVQLRGWSCAHRSRRRRLLPSWRDDAQRHRQHRPRRGGDCGRWEHCLALRRVLGEFECFRVQIVGAALLVAAANR